jgi:hypothetical protein
MIYKVTCKDVVPAGKAAPPGDHYVLTTDAPDAPSFYRRIFFYRTPAGSVVATDNQGWRLLEDGDLFRLVKAAVERYDEEQS